MDFETSSFWPWFQSESFKIEYLLTFSPQRWSCNNKLGSIKICCRRKSRAISKKKVQGTLESFVFLSKEVRKIFSCQMLEKPAKNWLISIITQQQRTSFIWETKHYRKAPCRTWQSAAVFSGTSRRSVVKKFFWALNHSRISCSEISVNLYWVIMARKILHCWLLLLSQQNYFPELL